jgi:hypothetical protein
MGNYDVSQRLLRRRFSTVRLGIWTSESRSIDVLGFEKGIVDNLTLFKLFSSVVFGHNTFILSTHQERERKTSEQRRKASMVVLEYREDIRNGLELVRSSFKVCEDICAFNYLTGASTSNLYASCVFYNMDNTDRFCKH